MSADRKRIYLGVAFLSATVMWMLLIFLLSAQNAAASGKTSGGFSKILFSVLCPGFADFSAEKQAEIASLYSKLIRKAAHCFVYFVLGGLSLGTVCSFWRFKLPKCALTAISFCFLYAATDEFHQRFVPGRSGEIGDVLLDGTAATVAIAVFCLLIYRHRKRHPV
ncbi:MAG: VanZ family protein [Clostridia bacterium]|nr:VanZ family protein [Clostridia bacterium]